MIDDAIYEGDHPLNNDNMVRVREVCCNNDGALFITVDRHLYAMGNFIGVCTSDQPIKVHQFYQYEIIQIAMGKQFAVILTRKRSKSIQKQRCTMNAKPVNSYTSDVIAMPEPVKLHSNQKDTIKCDDSINSIDTQSLVSTSHSENDFDSLAWRQITKSNSDANSMNSKSSGCTLTNQSNTTKAEAVTSETATKLMDIVDGYNTSQQPQYSPFIDNEYAIERWLCTNDQIETQVWCFGSINQVGQLGVGDHVRRTNAVEVRSLRDQGVTRICSGEKIIYLYIYLFTDSLPVRLHSQFIHL